MPELAMDAFNMNSIGDEPSGSYTPRKESFTQQGSPRSPWSPRSLQSDSIDLAIDGAVDNSIEQLYNNVCEMQSSDQSPSRASFGSFGGESRIDSELRQLVGDIPELETTKEVVTESKEEYNGNDLTPEKENVSTGKNSTKKYDNEASSKSRPTSNSSYQRPPIDNRHKKNSRKPNAVSHMKKQRKLALLGANFRNGIGDDEVELDNRDLGPFLLKQTREMISSGENPQTALDLGLRALKSFEKRAGEKPNLELVMCLHILAAIYCSLGQYNEAIPALERSIDIPVIEDGQDHALANWSGNPETSLGGYRFRVGDTCRYVAESHAQALQFDEAENLCQMALDIHRENSSASLEEAADRRLMALICDSKGDYEAALEHHVLASMALAANGQEIDVASIDCNVGDAYLSLARYDEAVFAYQKALTVFKLRRGENHPAVASVYVHLANLYNNTGKFKNQNLIVIMQSEFLGSLTSESRQKRLPMA
ncbi:Protein KINESIN LIGHT CHAIN-RELATED 3 [Quillaja saponaria]|uniref:Protein KINESIN LIGHT CHAIN-RELATED 3 n=1 Tax=Quillaja saponaria TaxID=32244 RepID=A0AAD7Q4D6_QUISA|nr:Protein KINESIN LIGHT CHAIN-RELATED 3 [Quillaja saponaria]